MVSQVVARSNLVFQIIILALLFASFILNKKRRYFLHGSTMVIAAVLNAFSFVLVMGPSFLGLEQLIVDRPLFEVSMATMAHGILGAVAEILALWVVVSWRLRSSTKYCARKKKVMQLTFVLWVIALFSGILLYTLLYGV